MRWPYQFTVSPEQSAQRRELLDKYARIAQTSILIPFLVIYLAKIACRPSSRSALHDPSLTSSSGSSRQGPQGTSRPQNAKWLSIGRRVAWWVDESVAPGWNTRREFLSIGCWGFWLGYCILAGIGNDYLHLTKRFAIVAASQLPIHYLLSLKSPLNPIQKLAGLSHEELNPYHRLLGRLLIAIFALHAVFYLNFYAQASLLAKRIRDADVQLGLLALTHLVLVNGFSLRVVRDWSYRLFYVSHIILSFSLLPILWFHVKHVRIYVLEAGAVYMVSLLHRYYFSLGSSAPANIKPLPNTSLVEISFSVPQSFKFSPGQHLYVRLPKSSFLPFFPLNPFSIASAPLVPSPGTSSSEQTVSLVVRRLSGPSSKLVEAASASPIPLRYSLPYGASTHFPDLLSFDRVLLFAGGVGATFTLPIYMDLLCRAASFSTTKEPKPEKGQTLSYQGNAKENLLRRRPSNTDPSPFPNVPQNIHHVWTVRSLADTTWALPLLNSTVPPHLLPNSYSFQAPTFMVHVTSSSSPDPPTQQEEALSRLQSQMVPDTGRPNFGQLVDRVFGERGVQSVAVLVCGPPQMEREIRHMVGDWVVGRKRKKVEVFWHAEGFGW